MTRFGCFYLLVICGQLYRNVKKNLPDICLWPSSTSCMTLHVIHQLYYVTVTSSNRVMQSMWRHQSYKKRRRLWTPSWLRLWCRNCRATWPVNVRLHCVCVCVCVWEREGVFVMWIDVCLFVSCDKRRQFKYPHLGCFFSVKQNLQTLLACQNIENFNTNTKQHYDVSG